jgi:hypothetical protein
VTPALGEQCDGGECCTAACTFKGPSEQCGVETRVCHDRPLCNGHDAACPNAERLSSEGSTCSDDEACTLEDTCRQGECTPGPRVCNAEAVVLGNGRRSMRVAVQCFSDQAGDCEATVVALAADAARRDAAEVPGAITATKRSKLKHAKHGGALKFSRKLTLRLNDAGKAALQTGDLSAEVVVTVRRLGSDFRPALAALRLLKFKK